MNTFSAKFLKQYLYLSLAFFTYCQGLSAQETTEIRVEIKEDAPKISKHIYGHFAEHLGRCIYNGIYVGDGSSIPNTAGVRNDIIAALKELNIPNLRWPGGCFADTYHWKDGVGPQKDRPKIVNTWWGGVTEDNSFGTHDFLNLCETLNAEAYLSGNVGSGTVQELADWVQYTNFKSASPMSDLRRENGRDEPWTVKFWGIGNEAWGCGGNMRAEYYADIYRTYATFMSDADVEGGIDKIASGASNDDYHWTEVLMKNVPHALLDGIALHHYSVIDWNAKGSDVDFGEDLYFKTMSEAWLMDELLTKHIAIMDTYDPENKVDMVVDEWGGWYNVQEGTNDAFLYQQNTMRDAMIAGVTLNVFHKHAERVKMANLAQVVNVLQAVILTDEEKMILTPTYHVLEMYKVHQEAQLLPVSFESPEYTVDGSSLPALSASASKDANGKIHMSLVNIDYSKTHKVSLDVSGLKIKDIKGRILKSEKIQDHNTFESPNKITPSNFKDFSLKKGTLEVTIPPFSVIVLEGV